ncbi:unnamed protein product [Trichogramma brassicae]|uniref:Uncharacterized protein n=1 Tax=Trichogramma brassicae TaxID=86971 RepID=A0A6H5ILE1_9HYME|nr:unnamed protein product [Trichogramma brassicae]
MRFLLHRYPDSRLAKLFNGSIPIVLDSLKQHYFIDRDGGMFRHILNFMRNSRLLVPENFSDLDLLLEEARYFDIAPMIRQLEQMKKELIRIKSSVGSRLISSPPPPEAHHHHHHPHHHHRAMNNATQPDDVRGHHPDGKHHHQHHQLLRRAESYECVALHISPDLGERVMLSGGRALLDEVFPETTQAVLEARSGVSWHQQDARHVIRFPLNGYCKLNSVQAITRLLNAGFRVAASNGGGVEGQQFSDCRRRRRRRGAKPFQRLMIASSQGRRGLKRPRGTQLYSYALRLADVASSKTHLEQLRTQRCCPGASITASTLIVRLFHGAQMEEMRRLRRELVNNWEIEDERNKLFEKFGILIGAWQGPFPELRDIFEREEIDWLLTEDLRNSTIQDDGLRSTPIIVYFAIGAGYKDEPALDRDGAPILRRSTPLHYLAGRRRSEWDRVTSRLFEIYDSFEANYVDVESDRTHFHVACEFGCAEVVEKFLELGQVDPDLPLPRTGDPALYLALRGGRRRVLELLLRHGANPNLTDAQGSTPLPLDSSLARQIFRRRSPGLDASVLRDQADSGRPPTQERAESRRRLGVPGAALRGARGSALRANQRPGQGGQQRVALGSAGRSGRVPAAARRRSEPGQ